MRCPGPVAISGSTKMADDPVYHLRISKKNEYLIRFVRLWDLSSRQEEAP